MDELIARLAKQREIVLEYKTEIQRLQKKIEASEFSQRLKRVHELLGVAEAAAADTEVEVRQQAMETYRETLVKDIHPAVKVTIYAVPVYDEEIAFTYACHHLPQALRFNKGEFERAAKALYLDFFTLTREPRVSIAQDLSRWNTDACALPTQCRSSVGTVSTFRRYIVPTRSPGRTVTVRLCRETCAAPCGTEEGSHGQQE